MLEVPEVTTFLLRTPGMSNGAAGKDTMTLKMVGATSLRMSEAGESLWAIWESESCFL